MIYPRCSSAPFAQRSRSWGWLGVGTINIFHTLLLKEVKYRVDGSILSASGYSLQHLFQSPARAPFVRGGDKPAFELIANHFCWRRSRAKAGTTACSGNSPRRERAQHKPGAEPLDACPHPTSSRRSSSPPAFPRSCAILWKPSPADPVHGMPGLEASAAAAPGASPGTAPVGDAQ